MTDVRNVFLLSRITKQPAGSTSAGRPLGRFPRTSGLRDRPGHNQGLWHVPLLGQREDSQDRTLRGGPANRPYQRGQAGAASSRHRPAIARWSVLQGARRARGCPGCYRPPPPPAARGRPARTAARPAPANGRRRREPRGSGWSAPRPLRPAAARHRRPRAAPPPAAAAGAGRPHRRHFLGAPAAARLHQR